MILIYVDPHVDPTFTESVFSSLGEKVMMVDNPECADIRLNTDLPATSFDGLTIVHASHKNYPPLLDSQYGTTIIVDRDTHDVLSRNISYLSIMVTGECDTACSYCQLDPTREWYSSRSGVSLPILDVFARSYDISYIRYTGGEPTLDMAFVEACNKLFPFSRKGMATNGKSLKDYGRVPIGFAGLNDLNVHFVKYIYADHVIDMSDNKCSYDSIALAYKRVFGLSSFFSLAILVNNENIEYAKSFIAKMRKHLIMNVTPFIETDRYGNFCMHPLKMCCGLGMDNNETTRFIRSVLRNKIGSLYFRAPKLDFVDSCYEVLGRSEKETCWLERLHRLPFDTSVTSFLRKKGYYDHIVDSSL